MTAQVPIPEAVTETATTETTISENVTSEKVTAPRPAVLPVLSWRGASKARLQSALEDLLVRLGSGDPKPEPQPEAIPNALDQLSERFGLSSFERDLLLLTAGHELDARFADLLDGPPTFARVSPRLADVHWSALAPDGPLRRGRLIRVQGLNGPNPQGDEGLVRRTLRMEEAVLHELLGMPHLDDSLRPYVDPLPAATAERLLPSQAAAAQALVELWTAEGDRSVAWLASPSDAPDARAVASAAGRALGWGVFVLVGSRLPDDANWVETLVERWRRDAALQDFALLVELDDSALATGGGRAVRQWLERGAGATALVAGDPPDGLERTVVRVDMPAPSTAEAGHLWRDALGPLAGQLEDTVERVAQQFPLPPRAIHEVAAELSLSMRELSVRRNKDGEPNVGRLEDPASMLWHHARRRARGGLDRLAQRLEPVAEWDDLILPKPQLDILHAITTQVRQRTRVYETWGFADKSRRGLGIGALFSGPSGTGKTLAGEVLSKQLELDLYRIDLSAVVSKYIGETERNLSRLFDAAERSGAILLFDEADSLFGKRSEVRDSHDRYANLEVSYLLQRIEAYRGLAILTTNFEKSLDAAFSRRLRFVVPFPLPSAADRLRIWQRVFPEATPIEDLHWQGLAQLTATGGMIRNIALSAAFLAAGEDRAVTMGDLAKAARSEFAKSGRQAPEQELKGWTR